MGHLYDQVRQEGYSVALRQAWDDLEAVSKERSFKVAILDGTASLDLGSREIEFDLTEKGRFMEIVVLHYLAWAVVHESRLPRWDWALFRQMPGGEAYQAAFQQRVIAPLADAFSSAPRTLVHAAEQLGGRSEAFGSATVDVPFLPLLPVRVTVWQGDEEVPGNATMLFPKTLPPMLPTEDYAVVGEVVLAALKRVSSVQ
ncbi:MAG: hypothetical protein A4E32_00742 [Methanomassiliicoccales archaeon PtaU1.Bin124]|nr:MAG: hypothetical protein A4E32_00742 [Methanomassiliicoccales archaeon PtaU1.Bin124]